jgi:hypothetical protein
MLHVQIVKMMQVMQMVKVMQMMPMRSPTRIVCRRDGQTQPRLQLLNDGRSGPNDMRGSVRFHPHFLRKPDW